MSSSTTRPFGKIRSFLWPIHAFEMKRFVPLFLIYALICFNYSILKVAKDALVITAPGSGAEAIPFIKVWAILPMAIFVTYLFTKLFNRFSQEKLFYIMICIFLGFFVLFTTVLYPMRDTIHPYGLADRLEASLPAGFKGLISIFRNWSYTLFYVMAELWGTAIMTVLFWGYANEITSVKDAKRFYALLGLGANLATITSGQIAVLLSRKTLNFPLLFKYDSWGQSLSLITGVVVLSGFLVILIFRWYHTNVVQKGLSVSEGESIADKKNARKIKMSIRKNFSYLAKSKYLLYIAVIVFAFNVAINMVEIVWKDQIKQLYPSPSDYSAYMGNVLIATGVLSTFIGLFICGSAIRKLGWTISAMITPAIVLITGVLFFLFICCKDCSWLSFIGVFGTTPLVLGIFFGTLQNVLSRACKFTLFDATKEIAFIPLNSESKMKGKAAIDGVGSRLGKSGGSIIHQFLLMLFGTVSLSAPYVGVLLLAIVFGWLVAVRSLGRRFQKLTIYNEKLDIENESATTVKHSEHKKAEAIV